MKNSTKRLVLLSVCVAVAMVLSYVEAILPPIWSAVPGIKLGLPNIIIIYVLYKLGIPQAAAVSLVRVCLSALLFGTVTTFMYSLAGAVLSLAVMALLYKLGPFTELGVSIAGAVSHNLGQIIVAALLLATREIGYYMIILAVTGTVAGIAVGIAAAQLIRRIDIDK